MEFIVYPLELLEAVHEAWLFEDDKDLVDRPLKIPKETFLRSWQSFSARWDGAPASLSAFLTSATTEAGSDLEAVSPIDWHPKTSAWLPHLSPTDRKLAEILDRTWNRLCRKISSPDGVSGERILGSSLLSLHQPFFVPGGRFREMYYWDSYWIVMGLMISEMYTSAMHQIEGLLEMLREYGFVPNGNRRYYLNRSQPPFMGMIVRLLWEARNENKMTAEERLRADHLLEMSLPLLVQEHRFWSQPPRCRTLTLHDRSYSLSHYHVRTSTPRPESFRHDVKLAEADVDFSEIASTAESGWDFSSRWCRDPNEISSLQTTSVIPVDLNAALYALEQTIETLSHAFEDFETEKRFFALSEERQKLFDDVFWDDAKHHWRDLRLEDPLEIAFAPVGYLSDFVPLAFGVKIPPEADGKLVVKALMDSGLIVDSGCRTSVYRTSQQWDAPNVWPPLQSLVVTGLRKLHRSYPTSDADRLADRIVSNFLSSVKTAYDRDHCIYEKYGSKGRPGIGGEYRTQIGFGWTIGTVLNFLTDGSPPQNQTDTIIKTPTE